MSANVKGGHTPGPWSWTAGLVPPDGPARYADIYTDGGDMIIASFNDLIPEGRANARLITAAPDMLGALELAKGRLELLLRHYPDGSDDCDHPVATRYVLGRVEAAIAKAEGRS